MKKTVAENVKYEQDEDEEQKDGSSLVDRLLDDDYQDENVEAEIDDTQGIERQTLHERSTFLSRHHDDDDDDDALVSKLKVLSSSVVEEEEEEEEEEL